MKKQDGPRDFLSNLTEAIQRNAAGDIPEALKKKKKATSDTETEGEGGAVKDNAAKDDESEEDKGSEEEDEEKDKAEAPKKPKEKDLFSSFLDKDPDMESMFAEYEDVRTRCSPRVFHI